MGLLFALLLLTLLCITTADQVYDNASDLSLDEVDKHMRSNPPMNSNLSDHKSIQDDDEDLDDDDDEIQHDDAFEEMMQSIQEETEDEIIDESIPPEKFSSFENDDDREGRINGRERKTHAAQGKAHSTSGTQKLNLNRRRTSSNPKPNVNQGSSDRSSDTSGMNLGRQEQQRKMSEKSKISSMSGDRRRDLESQLSEKLRTLVSQKEEQHQSISALVQQRHARFKMSRKVSSTVERILKEYNDNDSNNIFVDFYKLLQVSRDVDLPELKKKYRALALEVHPDKNPHPDAKLAFDALQDAYEVLSNSKLRADYDKQLQRMRNQQRWTAKRLRQALRDNAFNYRSRLLVFVYRIKNGRFHEEVDELRDLAKGWLAQLVFVAEHLLLLPSTLDRFLFVNEVISAHKRELICTVALLGYLITRK